MPPAIPRLPHIRELRGSGSLPWGRDPARQESALGACPGSLLFSSLCRLLRPLALGVRSELRMALLI